MFRFPFAPRTIALISLCAGALAVCAGWLLWQRTTGAGYNALSIALPVAPSILILLLPCIAAMLALEFKQRAIAGGLAGTVALCLMLIIASWVAHRAPILGYNFFVSSYAPQAWFPSAAAVAGATTVAIFSLVALLLSIPRTLPFSAPLAWAAGMIMLIGAPVQFVILTQVFSTGINWLALVIAMALMLSGIGLIFSQAVRAGSHERGARLRAFMVVLAISSTLTLWQMVRAEEVRQLEADVKAALDEVVRDIRNGIIANSSSIERLGVHYAGLNMPLPPEVFVNDARVFMRNYLAGFVVFATDTEGRVRYAARRAISLDAEPTPNDLFESIDVADAANGFASLGLPLPMMNGRFDIAVQSLQAGAPIRGTGLPRPQGKPINISAYPAFDSNRKPLGALVILIRPDISTREILRDTALEFDLRVWLDGVLSYERINSVQASRLGHQFKLVTDPAVTGSRYRHELTPGARVIERNLTAVPALVLLFAWASLSLLSFALYSERRAQTLSRERERILNQSLDIICTLDPDGKYVSINDAVRRVLGYEPRELIGRRFIEFAHPLQVEDLQRQWELAKSGRPPPVMPLRFMHKNGESVYIQGNARWSPNEQLFYCDMRDVTEQQLLDAERRHAEDTFRAGVEQAGCVVYEYTPDTGAIRWVGAVKSLTGYDPEEFAALGFTGWMNVIHPNDREHAQQILQRCIETRQPHTTDYRLLRKDGVEMAVLDRGRHLEDGEHGASRLIGALIDLTAIRQQEAALRRSEERYRIIATQVGAVIIEREIATGLLRAYGPVEKLFGFTKEQVERRPVSRDDVMIHPDDRAHVTDVVKRAYATVSSYYLEYRRRHRGGHYIYIAARGIVLPGPDGKAERSVVAYTDITERKLAEQRLSESEEHYRLAAEQAGQIVYRYTFGEDGQPQELRFAGATERVFGYPPSELHGLLAANRFALVHPDDLDAVRSAGWSSAGTARGEAHDEPFLVEHRMRHKDGHYVHVENRGAVNIDAQGNVTAIVGMLLDISARKTAELDRQTYTMQLRALADLAHQVSTTLSLHELLNLLSRSMRELLGANAAAACVTDPALTNGKLIVASFAEHYGLQRGQQRSLGSQELHDLVTDGNTPVVLTREQMDSHPKWSQLTQNDDLHHPLRGWLAAPLTARDSSNLGLLELSDKCSGDFTDSDLQVLSQLAGLASVAIENIRLYATLEERVAARTRELEMSNRELEAFSYSVSHDLRAPLRAIAGFSSILEQEYGQQLTGEARRYLQRITGGVERMANLIDDLLSLARVSRSELKRESIDLTALARTIVKRQRERWPGRKLDIEIDARMRTTADPRLVEVALENLIENALKFTSTRTETKIHIGRRMIEGKLAFFIADNGVGFDPKYASNLFGVFQRLHSASEFPGTGVGLATVHRIVQRHHGRVWAVSQIDQGATFYFTFDGEV
jgi:PAS domain S-box-containing protein